MPTSLLPFLWNLATQETPTLAREVQLLVARSMVVGLSTFSPVSLVHFAIALSVDVVLKITAEKAGQLVQGMHSAEMHEIAVTTVGTHIVALEATLQAAL
jgi:hypothetical protein